MKTGAHSSGPIPEQFLPFTVTVASNDRDITDAVAVRSIAYLRHGAPAAEKLRIAEVDDGRDDVILLHAKAKLGGRTLGSVRLHTNLFLPLGCQGDVKLPAKFDGVRAAELMRLGVANGVRGLLVTAALAKASYHICLEHNIEYMLVAGRHPVDQLYRSSYLFDDALEGERINLSYAPGVPHSILSIPVFEAAARWLDGNRTTHHFMVATRHPDIQLDATEVRRRLVKGAANSQASSSPAFNHAASALGRSH